MIIRLVFVNHGKQHLLRTNNAPHSFETACGRTVRNAMTGEHVAGDLRGGLCKTCLNTEQGREALRENWRREHRAEVASATAYVQSRFFPPLPAAYGELAVLAVTEVNGGNPRGLLDVTGLNPEPRGAFGHYDARKISADRLVAALRLEHLIDSDDD